MRVTKIIGIVIAIITIPLSFYNNIPVISLLPISVVVYDYYSKSINAVIMKSISVTIFYFVVFLRFVLLPFLISLSGEFYSIGRQPNLNFLNISIILMWIELSIHFIIINYLSRKHLKPLLNNKEKKVYTNRTPKILLFYVFISAAMFLFFPELFKNFKFVFAGIDTETISFFRGLDIRIILFSQILLYVFIIEYFSKKYNRSKNVLYYSFALLIAILNIVIIRNENRASLLINSISTYLILIYAFPNQKRFSLISGLIGVFVVILYVSILRNEKYNIQLELSNFSDILRTLQIQLQAYLSGPSYIANGLEQFANGAFFMNIKIMVTDILLWSGYVGNLIFESLNLSTLNTSMIYNSNLYFGLTMYGSGDQIIPLAVQGFAYFHIIGYFIVPLLMPFLMVVFEKKMILSKYLIVKYNYMTMVVVLSLYMGYNLSIIGLYFFDRFIIFGLFIFSGQAIYKIKKGKDYKL